MPKGQKPYKKEEGFKDKVLAAGDKLRGNLSKLRGPIEDMGKRVQKAAGPLANRFPEKKAKGGMLKKAKGRKC